MNNIRQLGFLTKECLHGYSLLTTVPRFTSMVARRCISNVGGKYIKDTGRLYQRRWRFVVPTGVGLSLLAVTQWNYLHKHGYPIDVDDRPELLNDVMVTCYCCLPLRMTSRIWGWLTSIDLPVSLRSTLYRFYASMFHANLDEIELELSAFPSLVEFFVRALKDGVRPIAQDADMISPADGKVLYFGPINSCRVEQVKGVTYDLRQFLGDMSKQITKDTKQNDYVTSLLKNPDNKLYQLIIYLAPGDYHRFHSPSDWIIKFRRHFPGKLLSVNPKVLKYMPNLFSLNERVVYIGEWAGGFMAYAAVGATNVGSIKIYCDKKLATNTIQWPKNMHWKEANLGCTHITKGDLFGEFRLGSTIVLLFEAPRDFQFCLQHGQTIKVGQAISLCPFSDKQSFEHDKQKIEQHLIMNVALGWKDIWKPKV